MTEAADPRLYGYASAAPPHHSRYLAEPVRAIVRKQVRPGAPVCELGCGNGYFAGLLAADGFSVVGVDASADGIRIARSAHPKVDFVQALATELLPGFAGRFAAVVSLEVIEHVYAPRDFAAAVFGILEPGGVAIVSTPYHGYLKNLALAVTGALDRHFTALWDHGHIKFWSRATLTRLLSEAGFVDIWFRRVGRIPPLAKSMIAIARRPR